MARRRPPWRSTAAATALALVLVPGLGGAADAAPPSPPSWQSPDSIHVKLRDDAGVDGPDPLLPPGLRNRVAHSDRLFKVPKHRLHELRVRGMGRARRSLPDLNGWFELKLVPGTDVEAALAELRAAPAIEIAERAPLPQPAPAVTPDFTGDQGYLGAAPDGIDASFAFTVPGGNGAGITIYDVEYSWRQSHEDLTAARGVPLLLFAGAFAIDPFDDDNHGTAVLGELIADRDGKGVTGIAWGAGIGLSPANTSHGYNPALAIILAALDGTAGDVILIEQQYSVCGLPDFGPVEWLSSVFDAIRVAVANGFVVVEAAGNGSLDLDRPECGDTFDRTVRDSGAIIVGAGQPPASGFDRQREWFSTFGSRVDVQGWGSGVMTAGYGGHWVDPDDPQNRDAWYTAGFNGTSSASPIVAGAAANLQGIALRARGGPLAPAEIRALLTETGSPQLGNTDEHIGPRPDLRQAIARLTDVTIEVVIDLKPGSARNALNPRAEGAVPVAIVTDAGFAASEVDPTTVRFGATGAEATAVRSSGADVDGDGDVDLLLHFRTQDTGIACGATSASLTGRTRDDRPIAGVDAVVTVGCR